jgi:hypothetical protein
MRTQHVPASLWRRTFDDLSRAYDGAPVSLEIVEVANASPLLAQKSQSAMPVAGASPVMRDRNHHYLEIVGYINEVVAEGSKPKFANKLAERLSRLRMFNDEVDGCKEILLESIPKARPLRVEVGHSLVNLRLSRL